MVFPVSLLMKGPDLAGMYDAGKTVRIRGVYFLRQIHTEKSIEMRLLAYEADPSTFSAFRSS